MHRNPNDAGAKERHESRTEPARCRRHHDRPGARRPAVRGRRAARCGANATGRRWFAEHGVTFGRHYTGSLACVPSRPTLFTGQYPTSTASPRPTASASGRRSRMRWLPPGEVPTLGNWFRAAGYDTHYDGKWHITHADLTDRRPGRRWPPTTTTATSTRRPSRPTWTPIRWSPFGFSGWVGPEPHGAAPGQQRLPPRPADRRPGGGLARGPLRPPTRRRRRRRCGRSCWSRASSTRTTSCCSRRGSARQPVGRRRRPAAGAAAPTADEDLAPSRRRRSRTGRPTRRGTGRRLLSPSSTATGQQQYRDLYYRLHAEVDGPIDPVRRAVTEGGSAEAVLVRTSDHGELLGAHGGLHQKWFNLYDEATRVPFMIARVGGGRPPRAIVADAPTSHVDIVPTLLAAAGIDEPPSPPCCARVHRGPPAARPRPVCIVDGDRRRAGTAPCT